MTLKIGITGHRDIYNYDVKEQELAERITKILKQNNAHQFIAYSALAKGSDILFAKVALEKFNSELFAILPFEKEEYSKDFKGDDLKQFNDLYDKAKHIEFVTVGENIEGKDRTDGYLKLGKAMVDQTDILIAMWDEKEAEGKGGTGDIVKYAIQGKRPIEIIKTFRTEREAFRSELSQEAGNLKRKFESLWKNGIWFALLASLVLSLSLSINWEEVTNKYSPLAVFASVELILLILLYVNINKILFSGIKQNLIFTRREAERLRVINAYLNGGIPISPSKNNKAISEKLMQMETKFTSESSLTKFDTHQAKSKLLELIDEQYIYHSETRPGNEGKALQKLERPLSPLRYILLISVFTHTLIAWIFATDSHDNSLLIFLEHLTLFFSLSIPAVYAAIEGFKYFNEYERKLDDSEQMVEFLDKIRHELNQADDQEKIEKIAGDIRTRMDEENFNWTLLVKHKQAPV